MTKTERLKEAYRLLKSGKTLEFISDKGKLYDVKVWIANSEYNPKRRYIFWQAFGSSANAMGIDNLRWICKTIGKCTSYEFKEV